MIGGEADLRRAEQIASQRNFGGNADYPVQLSIDYQESSNRLSVLLRIILVIPIMVVLGAVSGTILTGDRDLDQALAPLFVGGWLFLGPLLMILFRKKYPKWWFDWNLALTRFETRVAAFLLLLRDEYPSTDEEQSVHLNIEYPNAETDLNRFLPIIKWILAIPHYIVLIVLGILAVLVTILAWLLILILGRYPRGMFDFVVGVNRYGLRVGAYMWLLTTDRYPPFSLSE
jgi:hypothetical protein